MKPRPGRIIADLNGRIGKGGQLVDGLDFRGTHVRGGNHAQDSAALCKHGQGIQYQAETAPSDK